MKASHYILLVLFTIIFFQAKSQLKKTVYRAKIELQNGEMVKGLLYALNDSSITIIKSIKPAKDTTFAISQIKEIRLRKKSAGVKGFAFGAASGAVIGSLIGYISYSPPACDGTFFCIDFGPGFSALGGAFIGTVSGGILGLATGASYKKFVINGDIAKYNNLRNNTVLFMNAKK